MGTNDIKAFAAAGGANVLTQDEYLALAALSTGFTSGKASSKEVNKALRQATLVAAALAQFISDKGDVDVLDNGDVSGLATKIIAALNKTSQPIDETLTALAGLVGAANKLAYFDGADTAALTDFTSVGRDIVGKSDINLVREYLQLKSAALREVGNELDQIPDMSSWTSGTGWRRTPDGFIEVWGESATASSSTGIAVATFPIPFPNQCLNVVINEVTNVSSGVSGVKAWGLCKDTISKTGVSGILNVTGSPATGEFFIFRALGR